MLNTHVVLYLCIQSLLILIHDILLYFFVSDFLLLFSLFHLRGNCFSAFTVQASLGR